MQIASIIDWLRVNARLIVIGAIMAAIIHILATLAATRIAANAPVARLARLTPLHRFELLPPITPQTQPLRFMASDVRFAMCRYNTSKGPVSITARLPGKAWMLSLYSPDGDNFYTAIGHDGPANDIALLLTPVADRYLGLTPEARGKISEATSTLSLQTGSGIAVLRAPDNGIAYRPQTEAIMKQARCTSHPF